MKRAILWQWAMIAAMLIGAALISACATSARYGVMSPAVSGMRGQAVPGSVPAPAEEVWVIQKGPKDQAGTEEPAGKEEVPGSGTLLARRPRMAGAEGGAGEEKAVAVPLKHTDVHGSIQGYIATVEVTQQFQNPYSEKIEAVYVFPLPQDAGISEFVMTVGERKIRGIIREREEAVKIYQEARRQGYVASLLTQERPNIFTQSVANIEPGKQIDIAITYFHTLAYVDGWYEFVFPMVVGPRYNPAGSTQGVGAVARGNPGISGQRTEVPYLRPNERSGHDISLAVDIDAGVGIEEIACTSHRIEVGRTGEGSARARVALAASDTLPNKDFVLRYKVAGKTVKSALMVHRDGRGGFFTLMLYPPEELKSLPRRPVEMVFVMDTSGSMSGAPMAQSRAAVKAALGRLVPEDRFQVVNFAGSASTMAAAPLAASRHNVAAAEQYVDNLREGGGTEMITGIRAALDFPHDPERTRVVTFLTDGFIGNEADILKGLRARLAEARVFSFGVGSSPNRYLLDSMARLGRGAVAYLGLKDEADPVMAAYFERISHPALANIEVNWGGMKVEGVFPQRIPELFVGRPVVITGRFTGTAEAVTLRGDVGGERRSWTIPVSTEERTAQHAGLPIVWARMQLADYYDRSVYEEAPAGGWDGLIRRVALEYGIMSPYTAFVAVDASARTAGEHGTTVGVPVPVPEGVRYDTTVEERK